MHQSLGAFLATSPFVFLDAYKFQQDFFYELEHSRIGHFGFTTGQAWLFHLQTSLHDSFGWLLLFFAAVGMAWLILGKRFTPSHKLALLVYPWLTYWMIGGSHLAFQRYSLPLHPFIALYAALGLDGLYCLLRGWRWTRKFFFHWEITLVALIAMLAPNVRNDIQHVILLTRRDTRVDFSQLLQQSGLDQPNRRIFAGMYGTPYMYSARKGSDQGAFSDASIFIFDSFSHDRHLYDFSSPLKFYRSSVAGGQVIQLSPYLLDKEQVPIASQSIYSSYLQDLWMRNRPGPYFEIYLKEPILADNLVQICQSSQGNCRRLPAEAGYYFQVLMK